MNMQISSANFRYYYPATFAYIILIILLNTIFSYVPNFTVFGQSLSWADFVVGLIYVFRDFAQREIRHWVILAMLIGCGICFLLSEKNAALASLVAFAAGESIEWLIFTWTQKPLSQRILWSSLIGMPIDSYVNLVMLHQMNWANLGLMLIMKTFGIFALWYIWKVRIKNK